MIFWWLVGLEWANSGWIIDSNGLLVCLLEASWNGVPQVTMGFNTKSWSNDLDDLGYASLGPPHTFVFINPINYSYRYHKP